jgi:hypothetical protein
MEFTVESFDPPAKGASIARPSSESRVTVLTGDLALRFRDFVAGFFRLEKSESESSLSLTQ